MMASSPLWVMRTLAEVCLPVRKQNPVSAGRDRIRYVDIASVDGRTHTLAAVQTLDAAAAPARARQVLADGDTVFSTVRPYLQKIAYIGEHLTDEFASTGLCVLRPGADILPRYLFLYALSRELLDQVLPHQRGVSYPAVRDSDVKAALIPVPPLHDQRKIVDTLERHLSRLDVAEETVRSSSLRASSMREAWLVQNLRPVDRGQMRALGTVLVESRGGWSRSSRHLVPAGQGVPYLKMNNIAGRGGLELSDVAHVGATGDELARYAVRPGDVLFNSKNSAELVGKAAVASDAVSGWTFNENIMRLRFSSELDPHFVGLWFRGPMMRTAIKKAVSASTNVAAVYQHQLVRMPVWVPERTRQLSLVADFERVAEKVQLLEGAAERVLTRSIKLRRALLSAAFSGRLTEQVRAADAAEVLAGV